MNDEQRLLEEKYGGISSAAYEADCARLAAGEPLAYVIGHIPFLGLTIHLDSKPLIPRVETEWWMNELLNSLPQSPDEPMTIPNISNVRKHFRFLDLCAGSSAIGCAALARLPQADVYFGEIDRAHEATIRKNIETNDLDEKRAEIRIGDLFEPFDGMRFDVIASNPPYVPSERVLPESVASHEPAQALRAGEDGLSIIRRIAAELRDHLKPDGIAWIECDEEHTEAARDLFIARGFTAEIRTDQYEVPRLIVVSWKA